MRNRNWLDYPTSFRPVGCAVVALNRELRAAGVLSDVAES